MTAKTLENEYAYIKDSKVFLKGYLEMPDRQIGEVKNTEEEAIAYFENRYTIAKGKVETLKEEIETAVNKGSYLTKLKQLKVRLLNFDGIGNFIPLLEVLDKEEVKLNELIKENQANNLTVKTALLEEIKPISGSSEWESGSDALFELKNKWIRTGPVPKDLEEDYNKQFKELLDDFYQRRNAFYEKKNKEIDERLKHYQDLIDQSFELNRRDDLDEAFEDLKRIQREWKTVGEVPAKLLKNYYGTFKKHTSHFYEKYCKIKGIVIKKRVDPRIFAQQKMVKEADELAELDDMFEAAKRAKVLLNDWKNLRVPSHIADRNLAERFRGACDKIFELSYLSKVISRKYPTFTFLSEAQQKQTKYREMENITRKARTDLEDQTEAMSYSKKQGQEIDKFAFNNYRTQKRKLLMKEVILEELRRKSEA